jgi:hypothetical protein
MNRAAWFAIAIAFAPVPAHAQEGEPGPRAGDGYEIRTEQLWSETGSDGSTASSRSRDLTIERVIALRDEGVEIEFDLPADSPSGNRAAIWQFPLRALRPASGPLRLLNRPELESRIDRWLEAGQLPREACGRWIFTWDAFQIQCNAQEALDAMAEADLGSLDLRDGADYVDAEGLGTAVLRRQAGGPEGGTFVARMEVDPEAIRRQRVRSDAIIREMVGPSAETRADVRARAAERISGTITVTFETDAAGALRRRTRVMELRVEKPDGVRESQTFTDRTERRLVSRSAD